MDEGIPPHPEDAATRETPMVLLEALSACLVELEQIGVQLRQLYGPLIPTFVARALQEQDRAIHGARQAGHALEWLLAEDANN